MDHRKRIESPSVERRRLIEKRMEMIAFLINQMNEEENNEKSSKEEIKRKSIKDYSRIIRLNWLSLVVNKVHRMFP
ncbi:hypothetical protein [Paenibacillus prosopidis]|uniref:Uncharacterized protein n=1 Tax=Paenibacillus prosopidis TaxID=630520 RepID=A0A368VRL1_9BACL|nr:hypothetical protein [Paenibacillus prosopidis]RCW44297.1 hypothetical protein DFP97_112161 [Paenibacillus prosopidis]